MPRLTTAPSPSFWSLAKTFLITDLDTKFWEEDDDDIDLTFLNENNPPRRFALFKAALIYYKLNVVLFLFFLTCVLVKMNFGCVFWCCDNVCVFIEWRLLNVCGPWWASKSLHSRIVWNQTADLHCVMLPSLWFELWRLIRFFLIHILLPIWLLNYLILNKRNWYWILFLQFKLFSNMFFNKNEIFIIIFFFFHYNFIN